MYHGTATDFFAGVLLLGALLIGPLALAVINLVLSLKLRGAQQIGYSCFNVVVAGCFPFLVIYTNQFEWPRLLVVILKLTAFGIPIHLAYLLIRLRIRRRQAADAFIDG